MARNTLKHIGLIDVALGGKAFTKRILEKEMGRAWQVFWLA
jgi:hypothetical protein